MTNISIANASQTSNKNEDHHEDGGDMCPHCSVIDPALCSTDSMPIFLIPGEEWKTVERVKVSVE